MGRTEETGVNTVSIVTVVFKGHTGPSALPVFRKARGALSRIPARLTYD